MRKPTVNQASHIAGASSAATPLSEAASPTGGSRLFFAVPAMSVAALVAGLSATPVSAAPVLFQQTTSDLSGGTSYTDGARWTPAGAPSSGTLNDPHYYNVSNSVLRTPSSGTPEFGGAGASNLRVYINNGGRLIYQQGVDGTIVSDLRMNGGEVFVGHAGNVTLGGLIYLEADSEFDAHRGTGAQKQLTVNGVISDGDSSGANLQIQSSGDDGGVVRFNNGGNDYTGDTIVGTVGGNDTVLRMGAANAMPEDPAAGDIIINGPGFFQTNGFDTTVQGVSGAGTVENAGATAATLTIQGDQGGTNNSFGGVVRDGTGGGALSVIKSGATTTQTFSGANTYTGTTSVQGGRLVITSDAGLGATSGGTSIASGGGTVELAGSSTSEPFTLEARSDGTSAHLDASGNSSSTITGSGSITLTDGVGADPANFNITTNTTGTAVFNIAAGITGTGATAGAQNLNFGGSADGEGLVSGAIAMDTDATTNLNVGGDASWEFSGALGDVDNLNVSGGLATLSNVSKTIGTVNVSGGTLDLATGLTTANVVTVGSGALLTQTGSNVSTSQSGGYDIDGIVSLNGSDASMSGLTGGGIVQNDDDDTDNTNTLTIDTSGSHSFSGALRDGDGSGADGMLALEKTGSGTQTLTGASSYDGLTTVEAGALNIQSATALGSTTGETDIQGTGKVGLQGDIAVAEVFNLLGRADTGVHLENVANDNTITQAVELADNGAITNDTYTITSEAGTLTINDVVTSGLVSGDDTTLQLGGDSVDGTNGILSIGGNIDNLTKVGDSAWSVTNLAMADGTISSQDGVLALAGGSTSLAGNMVYEVLNSAELDVNGLGGLTVSAGQEIRGDGLVDGDIIAASGSTVTPGDASDATGTLNFTGDLALAGLVEIDIFSLNSRDLIASSGDLTIDPTATLNLSLGTLAPYNTVYVFATYGGTLTGTFLNVTGDSIPSNYELVYDYNGDSIALVNTEVPVPAPAPLALIGIGALALGVRGARRSLANER